MDITVPFLIVIILICCVLLYKIAGINPFQWRIKKAPKPKEEKKTEDTAVVSTKKSFIKRKQPTVKSEQAAQQSEPTNKPSAGAVVMPAFASTNIDAKLDAAINNADKLVDNSNEYMLEVKSTEEPKPSIVKSRIIDPSLSKPAFGNVNQLPRSSTFLKNPNIQPDMTSKDVERVLFGGGKPKVPPMPSMFDKKPIMENKSNFLKSPFSSPNKVNPFMDFDNDEDEFDNFFSSNMNVEKSHIDDAEYFEKKVIGEKVASTISKKADKYWI